MWSVAEKQIGPIISNFIAQLPSDSLDKLKLRLASRSHVRHPHKMKYVYLMQSISRPNQRYVGLTNDLQQRLATHNLGGSPHTSKYVPWRVVTAIRFDDDQRATEFERYLKSGSGRAFANKHLW